MYMNGIVNNYCNCTTKAIDTYKCPGDSEASKGALSDAVEGEAALTAGVSGVGKIMSS